MNENPTSDRIKLRDDAAWRNVEDEIILLDPETSRYFGVNQSGSLLWGLLAEGTTNAELVQRLVEAFPQAEATAEQDVAAFLAACRQNDLLERA